MQFLTRITIVVLICAILNLLDFYIEKSNSKKLIDNLTNNHIIIRLPKVYFWIGYIEIGVLSVIIIVSYYISPETVNKGVILLFSLFLMLGIWIVLVTHLWKIEVFRDNDDYFLCRKFFKTKKINYSECIWYKTTANSVVLQTDKRKIYIDNYATNLEFLLAMLTKHKVNKIN